MSKIFAWPILISILTILLVVSICHPYLLSDSGNAFLRGFVNQELISLMGVIVTISLASASSLHIELNRMQEKIGVAFVRTRKSIRISAYSLIILFLFSLVIVITKPILGFNDNLTAAFNSFSIAIILFSINVMADLIAATFSISALPPNVGLPSSPILPFGSSTPVDPVSPNSSASPSLKETTNDHVS